MARQAAVVILLVVMVAVVVGIDVLFFRNHLLPRLLANIGVVLLFAAFYLRYLNGR